MDMVKNIKIQFVNGDELTYPAEHAYTTLKQLREFIGSNTGKYQFDLFDSRSENRIIGGTTDDTLTCIYTEDEKCVVCGYNVPSCNLYQGTCSDCYLVGDFVYSVYKPNYYLYRVGDSPNRNYCAYRVYFDKDGEQESIELVDENDKVVKYIDDDVLVIDPIENSIYLLSKVPDIFRDQVHIINNYE